MFRLCLHCKRVTEQRLGLWEKGTYAWWCVRCKRAAWITSKPVEV